MIKILRFSFCLTFVGRIYRVSKTKKKWIFSDIATKTIFILLLLISFDIIVVSVFSSCLCASAKTHLHRYINTRTDKQTLFPIKLIRNDLTVQQTTFRLHADISSSVLRTAVLVSTDRMPNTWTHTYVVCFYATGVIGMQTPRCMWLWNDSSVKNSIPQSLQNELYR